MEIFSRRSLPHWYMPNAAHFVTYRLAGTLPIAVIEQLRLKKQYLLNQPTDLTPSQHKSEINKVLFADYESFLDNLRDKDWLSEPRVAAKLRENLYYHDGSKYHLHAYCIMPNHVHVLLTPSPTELSKSNDEESVGETDDKQNPLSKIMHSLKSYTANEANKILKRTGTFWQAESYDHWIRTDNELERVVNYIRGNPVAAGLVAKHEDWYWSSCHDRFLFDGDTSAWLP